MQFGESGPHFLPATRLHRVARFEQPVDGLGIDSDLAMQYTRRDRNGELYEIVGCVLAKAAPRFTEFGNRLSKALQNRAKLRLCFLAGDRHGFSKPSLVSLLKLLL